MQFELHPPFEEGQLLGLGEERQNRLDVAAQDVAGSIGGRHGFRPSLLGSVHQRKILEALRGHRMPVAQLLLADPQTFYEVPLGIGRLIR